ncbi:MAG: type 1 glutamine amidotransferase [Kiloniellales bacterium]|nr:type 1 glutamine amidotransferase [Kiloniellales bacterium]
MAKSPRLLVFQHINLEHPGIFRDFLAEDGIEWDAVELDEGAAIPDLGAYDGLWVMGGPMDVWEEDEHPWFAAEKAAIHEAVRDRGLPFLGLCLGHQLLADSLGGRVGKAETPEIGVLEVELTPDGRESPFYEGVAERGKCLQWHGAEVLEPPEDARVLASSPACRVQAMAIGRQAFSLQYHVEITETTVGEWAQVPAYKEALEKNLGAEALAQFHAETEAHMADFNRTARRLYDNFMGVTGLK